MAVLCRETQRAAPSAKRRRTVRSRAAREFRGAPLPGMPLSGKDRGYPGGAPQAVTLPPQSRTVRGLTVCARGRAQLREPAAAARPSGRCGATSGTRQGGGASSRGDLGSQGSEPAGSGQPVRNPFARIALQRQCHLWHGGQTLPRSSGRRLEPFSLSLSTHRALPLTGHPLRAPQTGHMVGSEPALSDLERTSHPIQTISQFFQRERRFPPFALVVAKTASSHARTRPSLPAYSPLSP